MRCDAMEKSTPQPTTIIVVYESEILIKKTITFGACRGPESPSMAAAGAGGERRPCVTPLRHFRAKIRAMAGVDINPTRNKGMRTEVFNFPTVPVLSGAYGWLGWVEKGKKISLCARSRGERIALCVSLLPHVIFASLTYFRAAGLRCIDRGVVARQDSRACTIFASLFSVVFVIASCTWRPVHTLISQCGLGAHGKGSVPAFRNPKKIMTAHNSGLRSQIFGLIDSRFGA